MKYELKIEVANIVTSLELDDSFLLQQLRETFSEFESNKLAGINIKINLVDNLKAQKSSPLGLSFSGEEVIIKADEFFGRTDLSRGRGEIDILPSYARESLANFLRIIYNILITKEGGLVLHACGIVKDNKTYIFFGPSQSGKSTVAHLSTNCTTLSDDLIVIKRVNGSCKVFGTPYWDRLKEDQGKNGVFEIAGLFKLVKDNKTYLKRLSYSQGLAEVFTLPGIPKELQPIDRLLNISSHLIREVPCYELHFLPNKSFWRIIEKGLRGK
ncbi:hypothetical protein ES703_12226 [subsurface metagenome]